MRIAVLNGPNLNLLGLREPELYGTTTLAQVENQLSSVARDLGVSIECSQVNGEGAMIDIIHGLRGRVEGAVVNFGAYSHTSLALRDALVGVSIPYVEVHVTNVYAREAERHHSMIASAAVGVVVGLGTHGYELALRGLVGKLAAAGSAP